MSAAHARTARTLDGVTYCPSCADYVGATMPSVTILPRGNYATCYRCGARALLERI